MEICLIYCETSNEFDIPLNATINYIKDLCMKIFSLQPGKFNIIYNNENITELDNETSIQEIVENDNNTPILIYIIPNENEEIEHNDLNQIFSEKEHNYFLSIKEKFDNFNKDFNLSNEEIQQFKNNYNKKLEKLYSLVKDFEENISVINNKINRYYNMYSYNFCIQFFQQNPEQLKINLHNLKKVNKQIDNCINNYKIIENQIIFQNKIIEFLNSGIEKFQNIKICNDEIKKNNTFNNMMKTLDLLYSILLNPFIKKNKIEIKNNRKKTLSHVSFGSFKEELLPFLDTSNKNHIKNNSIGDANILSDYKENDKLLKKIRNKSNNLFDPIEFNSSKRINTDYLNNYSKINRNNKISNFNKILEKYNLKLSTNYRENKYQNKNNSNIKNENNTIDYNNNNNIFNNFSNSSRTNSIKDNQNEKKEIFEKNIIDMNKKIKKKKKKFNH